MCSSEEGDLFQIDWSPKINFENNSSKSKEYIDTSPTEYVQWMKYDHNRPPVSLKQSPFFGDIFLTVSDWNFHIWDSDKESNRPLFTSSSSLVHLTGGIWSPSRPG